MARVTNFLKSIGIERKIVKPTAGAYQEIKGLAA